MQQIPSFAIHPSLTKTEESAVADILALGSFGKYATDHMATIHWSQDKGWYDPKITVRKPFTLDPSAGVLHYGQEIFEGMKAYKNESGKVFLFRPEQNAQRFNLSARRMSMPEISEALFIQAVEELVRIDHNWISSDVGSSLYLRPFMFASEPFLGVRPAQEFIFCVIASPAASYFKANDNITIWVEDTLTRAVQGGTGEAKCGGNYAGAMEAQTIAASNSCDQVLFLDAKEHRYIEELGGMNIFFVFKNGVIKTPSLNGTILHGITRASLIEIAKTQGYKIDECLYSFEELENDAASGEMIEAFACGTAAVVAPIGKIRHSRGEFSIGTNQFDHNSVTNLLKNKLVGIQTGRLEDSFNWVYPVALS